MKSDVRVRTRTAAPTGSLSHHQGRRPCGEGPTKTKPDKLAIGRVPCPFVLEPHHDTGEKTAPGARRTTGCNEYPPRGHDHANGGTLQHLDRAYGYGFRRPTGDSSRESYLLAVEVIKHSTPMSHTCERVNSFKPEGEIRKDASSPTSC